MSFEARNSSARCLEILYHNKDYDGSTDYVIQAIDGKEIKVHSFILKSRCTDFFDKLLESDFREKKEKKWKIPLPFKSVTDFVKFLYAFELDDSMSLEEIREMIEVCGAYDDTIKVAASELLENHLTKENVFEMIGFCNLHSLVKAYNVSDFHCTKLCNGLSFKSWSTENRNRQAISPRDSTNQK